MSNSFFTLRISNEGIDPPNALFGLVDQHHYISFYNDDLPSFTIFQFNESEKGLFLENLLGQAGLNKIEIQDYLGITLGAATDQNNSKDNIKFEFTLLELNKNHNELLGRIKSKNTKELFQSIFEEIPYYYNFIENRDNNFIDAFFIFNMSVITYDFVRSFQYSNLIIDKLARTVGFTRTYYFQQVNHILSLQKLSDLKITFLLSTDDLDFEINGYSALVRTLRICEDLSNSTEFDIIPTILHSSCDIEKIINREFSNILFLVGHGDDKLGIRLDTKGGYLYLDQDKIMAKINYDSKKNDTQLLGLFCCNANYAYNFNNNVKNSFNLIHTYGYISYSTIESFIIGFILGYVRAGNIRDAYFMGRFTMSAASYHYHLIKLI